MAMTVGRTQRGFAILTTDGYPPGTGLATVAMQSSAIGDHARGLSHPGSSFLWIGEPQGSGKPNVHLDREQVEELIGYLQRWLETGSLREAEAKA